MYAYAHVHVKQTVLQTNVISTTQLFAHIHRAYTNVHQ